MIDNRTIRPANESDIDALFEICLKTADGGADATALYSDPRMPGYVWSVPYLKFAPDFAFVLTDGDEVIGYVVGTPDTAAFDAELEKNWWPAVRAETAHLKPVRRSDSSVLDRLAAPRSGTAALQDAYPAHLHINILPHGQSGGWGRRLIETELRALADAGVSGVHLGINPLNDNAKGFYKHLGFEEFIGPDHWAYAMKLDRASFRNG